MTGNIEVPPLGEVVRPTRPRVKPSEHPDLPFIGMEHVESQTMKLLGTVSARTIKSAAVHFKPGDVLYGRLRPYLNKVYRPHFEGLCSAEFIVLPENERIDGTYLQYLLNSSAFVRYASHLNAGDRPRVDFDQLAPYPIPLPPKYEQRRIVAEIEKQFSRLDKAVANLKRVKANLKRYKAAVLKAAVEGRLVPTEAELAQRDGRHYETGIELLRRVAEASGVGRSNRRSNKPQAHVEQGEQFALPDGWVWTTTEQLGEVQLGRQRSPKNRSKNNPVKYIRAANITEAGLDLSDVLDMEFSPDEQERYRLQRGDIVLSEASGSPDQVGKPAIWLDELPICCFQNTVIRLRPALAISSFLVVCFRAYYASGVFARIASGVGINHLSANKFSRVRVPLPPLNEQGRIVAEVDRALTLVESLAEQVSRTLVRASRLRDSVLAAAFGSSQSYGEASSATSAERGDMKKRKLPSLPPRGESETEDLRVDLETVLRRHQTGMPPEDLFREAGYLGDQVDAFYRDLARLADRLEQSFPGGAGSQWPIDAPVTIKLKR